MAKGTDLFNKSMIFFFFLITLEIQNILQKNLQTANEVSNY